MLQEGDALEEEDEGRTAHKGKTEEGDHGQSMRKHTPTEGKQFVF